MASVAVIDIGSNSIKVLVASKDQDGRHTAVKMRTIEARISAGISREDPRLSNEGIERGVAAVAELADEAKALAPTQTILVATSAVRDAKNGADFCEQVQSKTGHAVRILSGDEEANLIGRGLLCDPLLNSLKDFHVFDLGGGSLECLAFRDRRVEHAASLPLGCVRLTERFVEDPSRPFEATDAVEGHVRTILTESGFPLDTPASVIGTGGTLTTARAVIAAASGQRFDEVSPDISLQQLQAMLGRLGPLPLADRKKIPGLPPARADIFPTALATLVAVASLFHFRFYRNSLYNLRWGLAAEALDRLEPTLG